MLNQGFDAFEKEKLSKFTHDFMFRNPISHPYESIYKEKIPEIKRIACYSDNSYLDTLQADPRSWMETIFNIHPLLKRLHGDITISFELGLPSSSARVDIALCGSIDNVDTIYLVECKQWTDIEVNEKNLQVKYKSGHGYPHLETKGYRKYLTAYRDLNNITIDVKSLLYFQNSTKEEIKILNEICKEIPSFNSDFSDLPPEIFRLLPSEAATNKFRDIYKPTKNKIVMPTDKADDYAEFLVGSQVKCYEDAMRDIKNFLNSSKDKDKMVLKIRGGVGSGKTLIARLMHNKLMQEGRSVRYSIQSLSQKSLFVSYVKKSNTLKLKSLAPIIPKSPHEIAYLSEELFDTTLIDESHKITSTATISKGTGNFSQIVTNIIKSSKVTVFFFDEHQHVPILSLDGSGYFSAASLDKAIGSLYPPINKNKSYLLYDTFRLGGDTAYVSYLKKVLFDEGPDDLIYETCDSFKFKIFDDIEKMKMAFISDYADKNYARGLFWKPDENISINREIVNNSKLARTSRWTYSRDTKAIALANESDDEVYDYWNDNEKSHLSTDYNVAQNSDCVANYITIMDGMRSDLKSGDSADKKRLREKRAKAKIYVLLTRASECVYLYIEDGVLKDRFKRYMKQQS